MTKKATKPHSANNQAVLDSRHYFSALQMGRRDLFQAPQAIIQNQNLCGNLGECRNNTNVVFNDPNTDTPILEK